MLEQLLDFSKIEDKVEQASKAVNDKKETMQQQYERFNRLEDDVNEIAEKAREIDSLKKWAETELEKIKKYAAAAFGIIVGLELLNIILTILL